MRVQCVHSISVSELFESLKAKADHTPSQDTHGRANQSASFASSSPNPTSESLQQLKSHLKHVSTHPQSAAGRGLCEPGGGGVERANNDDDTPPINFMAQLKKVSTLSRPEKLHQEGKVET